MSDRKKRDESGFRDVIAKDRRSSVHISEDATSMFKTYCKEKDLNYTKFFEQCAVERLSEILNPHDDTDDRMSDMRTQGKKGCEEPRINLAFTPENHKYIKEMAIANKTTMTRFCNHIIDLFRHENTSEHGWIPTSDRLPEPTEDGSKPYLVTTAHFLAAFEAHYVDIDWYNCNDPETPPQWEKNPESKGTRVIAWMPVPKPYYYKPWVEYAEEVWE